MNWGWNTGLIGASGLLCAAVVLVILCVPYALCVIRAMDADRKDNPEEQNASNPSPK